MKNHIIAMNAMKPVHAWQFTAAAARQSGSLAPSVNHCRKGTRSGSCDSGKGQRECVNAMQVCKVNKPLARCAVAHAVVGEVAKVKQAEKSSTSRAGLRRMKLKARGITTARRTKNAAPGAAAAQSDVS
jgi:hypothetical protein